MTKRRGGRFGRRGAATVPWSPLTDSDVIEFWDERDASGTVDSLTGKRAGIVLSATGAQRPEVDATGLNGSPGLKFSGAQRLAGSANLSAYSSVIVAFAAKDAVTGTGAIVEHTTDSVTQVGGFGVWRHLLSSGLGSIAASGKGITSYGVASTADGSYFDAPQTCVVRVDTPVATASQWIQIGKKRMTLTARNSACVAGPFANATLHVGGRGAGSLYWNGTMTGLMLLKPTTSDAKLETVRRWLETRISRSYDIGRVFVIGDSTDAGYESLVGGWRLEMETRLNATGTNYLSPGALTLSSTGMTRKRHLGQPNGKLRDYDDATLTGHLTKAEPDVIVWGHGLNDIAGGRTAQQLLDDHTWAMDIADGLWPNVKHIRRRVNIPTLGVGAPFAAVYAEFNAALPAFCAARSRCTFAATSTTPATSDGVHPIDGSTGYGLWADVLVPSILSQGT